MSKLWTPEIEDKIDYQFIMRVLKEVTLSCALPFALPADRIPEYMLQAAQYFWLNCDYSVEERYYMIKNSDICKGNKLNKIVQLPSLIMGVHGVYKLQESLRYGGMSDFSVERMMLTSFSMFGGSGELGNASNPGYKLSDAIASMYEIDTFNLNLNAPLTYNFNQFSSKLVLLGDLGYSDILIATMVRCRMQDLYNNLYYFRYVVDLAKLALSSIYGRFEFKLPGGITINYSDLKDEAKEDMEEIKEWIENNRAADYFFMPNTL